LNALILAFNTGENNFRVQTIQALLGVPVEAMGNGGYLVLYKDGGKL